MFAIEIHLNYDLKGSPIRVEPILSESSISLLSPQTTPQLGQIKTHQLRAAAISGPCLVGVKVHTLVRWGEVPEQPHCVLEQWWIVNSAGWAVGDRSLQPALINLNVEATRGAGLGVIVPLCGVYLKKATINEKSRPSRHRRTAGDWSSL